MSEENGLAYRNKRIACPHCGEQIFLQINWEVNPSKPEKEGNYSATSAKDYWLSTLTEAEKEIAINAENSGIVAIWAKIFSEIHGPHPRIPAKTFLAWCRVLQPRNVPPESSRFLTTNFPESRSVRVMGALKVSAIILDGRIEQVIPQSLLEGDGIGSGHLRLTRVDTKKIDQWIRTKFGYVATCGFLFDELRRKSFGHFDQPGVSSND